MKPADATLRVHLYDLEKRLMDGDFRRDRERLSGLLHPDFREFGSSGTVWSREAILDLLAGEPPYVPPVVDEFTVCLAAVELALVTYRTVGTSGISLRSSLWVNEGEEWKLIFHQGTKVPIAQE